MLYYRLFVRVHYNNTTQQIQSNRSKKNQRCNCFFEEFIKPGLRNFEAELVIDGACGGSEYPARLVYNPQQSAVKSTSGILAFSLGR